MKKINAQTLRYNSYKYNKSKKSWNSTDLKEDNLITTSS